MMLLHVQNMPILEQLELEEALLRTDDRNFCIINEGSPPAIVMGISGKAEELVDLELLAKAPIPLIKRFSGGGTVVVDEKTLFISFICQKNLHSFEPYPEPIMRWTAEVYREALGLESFHLKENDYALGEKKFGGNAQYLRKERWLHHSTLLWDFSAEKMRYLQQPKKAPAYRMGRSHLDFLCRLSEYVSTRELFLENFKEALSRHVFLQPVTLEELSSSLKLAHRKSTSLLGMR
ncbi:MAG: Lipoate-protein ligase LplJ [Chlamydiae bacterium]|nr:Lipoate-protein ligase LplJ [Chlamydiota bacterium]